MKDIKKKEEKSNWLGRLETAGELASTGLYLRQMARAAENAGLMFLPKQIADKYLIPYEAKSVEYKKWVTPKSTKSPEYDWTGIDTPGDPTM